MTCIVGIADGKQVWLGGDSAGTAGWKRTIRADAKVFTNGKMVFGFTSSFRMGQLLRYKLSIPLHYPDDDPMKYMCTTWIDAVRECLKTGGYATMQDGGEVGGCFLVGYKGRLFQVDSDYQVGEPTDGYSAVGCGGEYALGSLHTSTGKPEQRITSALTAAAYFSIGVAAPFLTVTGGEAASQP